MFFARFSKSPIMPYRLAGLLLLICLPLTADAQRATCSGGTATQAEVTYRCDGVDLLSRVSLSEMNAATGNDVWGWTHAASGREFALMGLDNGTYFVEITDPELPVLLGKLPTATAASLWRDMKVYQDHMYVVSEAAAHGMQVFDLRRLLMLSPNPNRILDADVLFTGPTFMQLGSAHNVAINEDSGFAYVVGARNHSGSYVCAGGLYMVDITSPAEPAFAGCFAADGYTHDVQCVMYDGPDERYHDREICLASNENTVTIVDVTQKDAPVMISQGLYYGHNVGYTHQGWLSEDSRYFFVNDELDSEHRTIIFDVSDLEMPEYITSHYHTARAITHNLFIDGQFLYAANYMSGLRVLDIGPALRDGSYDDIYTVAYFDTFYQTQCPVTSSSCNTFDGAWSTYPYFESGTVLVSDISNGLFMLRPTDLPTGVEPEPVASLVSLTAHPNPFAGRFELEIDFERDQQVTIEIFDVLGRRVRTVHSGHSASGVHQFDIDMRDAMPGVYVVRAVGETFAGSVRVTRMR
jgi:choice-of-anchor B domain-containing protein